jgi:hypothetical protein
MSITYEREEEMLMHARIQTQLLQQLVELLGKQIDPHINPYGNVLFGKMYEKSKDPHLTVLNNKIALRSTQLFRQSFLDYSSQPLGILNDKERTELSEECHELSDEYEKKWQELVDSGEIDASEGTPS